MSYYGGISPLFVVLLVLKPHIHKSQKWTWKAVFVYMCVHICICTYMHVYMHVYVYKTIVIKKKEAVSLRVGRDIKGVPGRVAGKG